VLERSVAEIYGADGAPTRAQPQRLARPLLQYWLIAVQVPLLVLGALFPLRYLFAHVSRDYGEGWSAYWSRAAIGEAGGIGRGQLYSLSHEMITNNYPPLYFLTVGHLGQWLGDPLIAGRLVSVAGLGATSVLCGVVVWRLGRSRLWAVFAGLLVLDYAVFPFNHFLAVNNPQWLAQATMLLAVVPLLTPQTSGKISRPALVVSALCVGLTLLIKHNVLAWPLAVTLWLGLRDRRALAIWLMLGAMIAAAAGVGLYAAYGRDVFVEILGYTRHASLSGGLDGLIDTATFAPLLIAAWVGGRAECADPRWLLLTLYTAIAVGLGLVQRFGAGVVDNAHFEAIIAAILLACAALGHAQSRRFAGTISQKHCNVLSVLMLGPLLISWPITGADRLRDMAHEAALERQYGAVIQDVRARRGAVLCEDLAVCFWAGKPMALDFFSYGQKLRSHTSPAALEAMIAHQGAGAIVLDLSHPKQPDAGRLPLPLPVLIHHNYQMVREVPGLIEELVPRDPAPRADAGMLAANRR